MPAGLAKCDLASFRPTKEELEAARTILNSAGGKELRSKVGSMSSWLKANSCNDASSSRGDDRRRWLEHFLVVQLRSQQTQKTTKVTKKPNEVKATYQDWVWMAAEEMDKPWAR